MSSTVVPVRLDDRRLTYVDARCAAENRSRSNLIQSLIDEAATRETAPVVPDPAENREPRKRAAPRPRGGYESPADPVMTLPTVPAGPAPGGVCPGFRPSPQNALRCMCGGKKGSHR